MVVESQIEQKVIRAKTHRDKQFPCQEDMQGLGDTQNEIVLNQGKHEDRTRKGGHEPPPNRFAFIQNFVETHGIHLKI